MELRPNKRYIKRAKYCMIVLRKIMHSSLASLYLKTQHPGSIWLLFGCLYCVLSLGHRSHSAL